MAFAIRTAQLEGVLPKWNGARVSHPQPPELPMSARNSTGLGVVERAAAETAALHRLQNDLGNTPLTLPPNAIGWERSCVQSTSRSTGIGSEASSIFQEAGFAKLLRLVFDTAALRGQCADAHTRARNTGHRVRKHIPKCCPAR